MHTVSDDGEEDKEKYKKTSKRFGRLEKLSYFCSL